MKRFRNSKGMTLIEILIVMAIIGTLMSVLLPQIFSRLNKSKISETRLRLGQVVQALNMYYTDCGTYPASLDGLLTADPNCSNWGPDPYIKSAPKDAWQQDLVYSIDGSSFVLKSLGKDRKEGGDGVDADILAESN